MLNFQIFKLRFRLISLILEIYMIKCKSIKTRSLSKKEIFSICKLKNTNWRYGIKSQLEWFNNNLKSNDTHNLFFINDKIVGYTALRKKKYFLGKKKKNLFFIRYVDNRKKIKRSKFFY